MQINWSVKVSSMYVHIDSIGYGGRKGAGVSLR